MSGGFPDFAKAMTLQAKKPAGTVRNVERVAVLGGGADARLLAAMALAQCTAVTLFSAYGRELNELRGGGGIAIRGAGPLGSYQIDAENAPSVTTTAELDAAVADADVIFLTGPVHKQRTYAMVLADHLRDGQVLVLAPGRTLGALEARWILQIGGCEADIVLVEAATLPFWYEMQGPTLQLSEAAPCAMAALPAGRTDVLEALAPFLPHGTPASGTPHSSFADGSALVEVPALVLGGTAIEPGGPAIPMGGTPLVENATFRNLIGPDHLSIIADLAGERRETARRFGVRDLPDDEKWLDIHGGQPSGAGARPVPDRESALRMVRDGVIGSLVPLVSAARIAGVGTPATSAMVALASSLLKADLATAGRRLAAIGVEGHDIDQARRDLDQLAGFA